MQDKVKEVFTKIHDENLWNSKESVSGNGSTKLQTQGLIEKLPILFNNFNIKSILDVACGDFGWMSKIDLTGIDYLGADIVKTLIDKNIKKYPGVNFSVIDVTDDLLPEVDIIMCRDCLVHLSYENINKAIKNICESGSKYLLVTNFTNHIVNNEIDNGNRRTLNFESKPFNFPAPLYIINEGCTEHDGRFSDKSMCLWEISTLKSLFT